MKIGYGSSEKTEILDDNGSTEATITQFYDGKQSRPVRHRYRIKRKVTSHLEEEEVFKEFMRERLTDKTILDPAIEFEYSPKGVKEGYYFVIKCYTKLEY